MSETTSSFWGRITTWLVKSLWPWIVEHVWPVIRDKIIGVFVLLIDDLIERVFTSSSDEKYQQAEEALNRAAEADKKAETAENKTEAEGYRELASRWREIAEHYEREVKDLRQKLDSLATQSAEKFQEDLEDLNLDEIIEEHNGKIQIEGKDLPPLPSPGR